MRTIGEVFGTSSTPAAPPAAPNPWARDEQGRFVGNLTEISKLVRENPRRAIELCKAAGEDLNRWFPMNPK